jgi:hypothetical protein
LYPSAQVAVQAKAASPPSVVCSSEEESERTGATIVEVAASHSVFLSQPTAVAGLIKTAIEETAASHAVA